MATPSRSFARSASAALRVAIRACHSGVPPAAHRPTPLPLSNSSAQAVRAAPAASGTDSRASLSRVLRSTSPMPPPSAAPVASTTPSANAGEAWWLRPERPVQEHLRRAATLQQRDRGLLVLAARGAGDLHLAGLERLHQHHLAHRALDAGAGQQPRAHPGPQQRVARSRHHGAGPHLHRWLGDGEDGVGFLAVTADRAQAHVDALGRRAGQQVVQRHRLAGVLGHAHHGDHAHALVADAPPQRGRQRRRGQGHA
jgi:hypothetical protein